MTNKLTQQLEEKLQLKEEQDASPQPTSVPHQGEEEEEKIKINE